jgi:hypothetical protein
VTGSVSQLSADVSASRYEIERKLGQGATGAVYLARDRETGEHVALKKLFHVDAKSVLRLKHEFRSLVDVAHPHIIKLYDMGRADDCWFLTMEFLDGVDLSRYLDPTDTPTDESLSKLTPEAIVQDNNRLLSAFLQLARGIQGLHAAGMLHRDLKPNNVIVVNGRVIVLDFGLVRDLSAGAATMTEDGSIAGTPAYMAPEQIKGSELGAPADWYAFGVMLYEALAGELPIDGTLAQILRAKLESDPTPVRELAPNAPPWLNDLCMALLRRDAAARPKGDQVVSMFEKACQRAAGDVPPTATDNTIQTDAQDAAKAPLVGRQRELAMLRKALADAQRGAAFAHIRGPSGTGKSMLVEHFLDEVESEAPRGSLLLRSRCYELEQMPFKALDAVMDAIVRHLLHLDDLEVAQVLPHEISALVQLFPVLERLRAVKRLARAPSSIREAVNERQRAEAALRQLLDRLAARAPVVLWIDDLQWGDLDSARILLSWMQEPTQAPILFVFSYRSEEITTSTCLAQLFRADDAAPAKRASEQLIDIAPLGSADIQKLCEHRLGGRDPAAAEIVARIVREAHGSPFLAAQLTVMAEAKIARGDSDLTNLSIDVLVAQTSAMLPNEAKSLLAVLAVAGRPMPPKIALQASGVRRNGRAAVHALRGLNLVRTREIAGDRLLEVYHDRVRERVQASLDAETSALVHQHLLDALEFSGHADADWLHTLALGAGQAAAALQYGLAAAERANSTLAFERAAELYERCIVLTPVAECRVLWDKLAVALVRCGHGIKAAEAYLKASEHAPAEEAVQLRRLAAGHFLRSGRFEEGEALVKQVLNDLAISVPQTERGLIAAIVWERARLKLRGSRYTSRDERDVPAGVLARQDALEMLAGVTQQYDPLRGTLFQLRAFHSALDAGEARRVMRAFGSAAVAVSLSASTRAARKADLLLERAENIARQLTERDYGSVCVSRAISAFMLGRVRAVIEPSHAADHAFRNVPLDDPQGSYYLRYIVASVRVGALHHLGEFHKCREELDDLLREAGATQNRSLLLQQTLNQTSAELIDERTAMSRSRLDEQARELPQQYFGVLHVLHMVAVSQLASFTNEYTWAHEAIGEAWAKYLNSPLRRGAYLAVSAHASRARMLLNQYVHEGRKREIPSEVRDHLKQIRSSPAQLSIFAERLEARLHYLAGQPERAAELLQRAVTTYETSSMPAEAAVDRIGRCFVLGEDKSDEVQQAQRALREMGVANPLGMVRFNFPELMAGV